MVPLIRLIPLVLSLIGQPTRKSRRGSFSNLCQAGKFTEATANFDAKMKEVLGPAKLEELWKKLGQQLGPIEKMGAGSNRQGRQLDPRENSLRLQEHAARCPGELQCSKGQIEGFFLNAPEKTADTPDPSYVDKSKFTEEPITVGARDWPLPGTLTRPRGVASAPLVILVHGSGPNDRDETLGPNTPFRDLAHGLASRGIAVLRYDKRTFAHKQKLIKEGLDKTITIKEEVIDDVLATVAKARDLSGIDPDRIFVLGHSGGGSLAPLIAQRDGKLAGIILLAAGSRPVEEGLREQLNYVKSVDRDQAEAVGKIQKELEDVFARDESRHGARRRDHHGSTGAVLEILAGYRPGAPRRQPQGSARACPSRRTRLSVHPGRF